MAENQPDAGASEAIRDEPGLTAALDGLAELVFGDVPLELVLTTIALLAVVAVPGAEGAGVTLEQLGASDTIVASTTFVRDVDEIQYRLGEGPCISAAATGRTVESGALGEDANWPVFGPEAAELGVHSAISLPLVIDGRGFGALNVYSHQRDAFDQTSRRVGEQFSKPAAIAVHNALTLDRAQRANGRLEIAVGNRSAIDQAVGIIMSQTGITADQAFLRLRVTSQQGSLTVTAVAAQVVADAVRIAQAGSS